MQLAEALKTLDIDLDLAKDAVVTDVLIAAKVIYADGTSSVAHAKTEGTDWITAVGLAEVMHNVVARQIGGKE